MRIYADHGVHWLWLVDPRDRTLEVYALESGRWVRTAAFAENDRVRAEPFQQIAMDLANLWIDTAQDRPPSCRVKRTGVLRDDVQRAHAPCIEGQLSVLSKEEILLGLTKLAEIRQLADLLRLTKAEEVLHLIEAFYPHSRIPPKVQFGIQEIMEEIGGAYTP